MKSSGGAMLSPERNAISDTNMVTQMLKADLRRGGEDWDNARGALEVIIVFGKVVSNIFLHILGTSKNVMERLHELHV